MPSGTLASAKVQKKLHLILISLAVKLPFPASTAIVRKWQKPKSELMREKMKIVAKLLQNCTFPAKKRIYYFFCNFILWLCLGWTWKCFYYPLELLSRPSQTVLAKSREHIYFRCWFSFQENGVGRGHNDKESTVVWFTAIRQPWEQSYLMAEIFLQILLTSYWSK